MAGHLDLHPQRVGKAEQRRLHRRIWALQRDCAVGQDRADIDDRAALALEVGERGHAALDHSEIADVEHPPMLCHREFFERREDGDRGVVNPGVEAAERVDGALGDMLGGAFLADVDVDRDRFAALVTNGDGGFVQGERVAGREHDFCSSLRGAARGG